LDAWLQLALTSVSSVLASSGFWAYMQYKDKKKDATTRLLMGMAYDKITTLGLTYITRGSITMDEFEDFRKYFYEPYEALGGNGVAKRIMRRVEVLPIRPHAENPAIFQNNNERVIPNVRVTAGLGQEAAPQ
jgi:hypothetical protein